MASIDSGGDRLNLNLQFGVRQRLNNQNNRTWFVIPHYPITGFDESAYILLVGEKYSEANNVRESHVRRDQNCFDPSEHDFGLLRRRLRGRSISFGSNLTVCKQESSSRWHLDTVRYVARMMIKLVEDMYLQHPGVPSLQH